jgi:hypothetical protein
MAAGPFAGAVKIPISPMGAVPIASIWVNVFRSCRRRRRGSWSASRIRRALRRRGSGHRGRDDHRPVPLAIRQFTGMLPILGPAGTIPLAHPWGSSTMRWTIPSAPGGAFVDHRADHGHGARRSTRGDLLSVRSGRARRRHRQHSIVGRAEPAEARAPTRTAAGSRASRAGSALPARCRHSGSATCRCGGARTSRDLIIRAAQVAAARLAHGLDLTREPSRVCRRPADNTVVDGRPVRARRRSAELADRIVCYGGRSPRRVCDDVVNRRFI